MIIKSRKELNFVIMADRMMTYGVFHFSLRDRIHNLFFPDYIRKFLVVMRMCSFYHSQTGLWWGG